MIFYKSETKGINLDLRSMCRGYVIKSQGFIGFIGGIFKIKVTFMVVARFFD